METNPLKPYLIIIGLLIVTSLALAFSVDVFVSDEAGVRVELPDQVGEWTGDELRFCQAPACQETHMAGTLTNREVCPKCGGKLDSMSKAERDLLPPDTILLKKRYSSPEGAVLFASVVMSGRERSSIHRPQLCLVGQGNEIIKSTVVPVPLTGRSDLPVMLLDMLRNWRSPDGRQGEHPSYYAYWFVGKGRETPYNLQRMIWMATDRIFHNTSHRWAYISVSGGRDEAGEYVKGMKAFVGQMYPYMAIETPSSR
jgi:hypothetical protein